MATSEANCAVVHDTGVMRELNAILKQNPRDAGLQRSATALLSKLVVSVRYNGAGLHIHIYVPIMI
eukprot:1193928-Prorocentrum_minimum.AAC.1